MITIATMIMLLSETPVRVFDPSLDDACRITTEDVGHEIKCPDPYDYDRAEYIRRLPPLVLPGHTSDGAELPTSQEVPEPTNCQSALVNLYDHAAQFNDWLQKQKNSFNDTTLTRNAAYAIEQMVRSYYMQVAREARAKERYKASDQVYGNTSCATHANIGTKEIYRIGDLAIHELNKGNRNMDGTGLNPYHD